MYTVRLTGFDEYSHRAYRDVDSRAAAYALAAEQPRCVDCALGIGVADVVSAVIESPSANRDGTRYLVVACAEHAPDVLARIAAAMSED